MIRITYTKKDSTLDWLNSKKSLRYKQTLAKYGREGVSKLRQLTPKDSGITAASWRYKVEENQNGCKLYFINDVVAGKDPLVILLEFGHRTRRGGYVTPRPFINQTIEDLFTKLSEEIRRDLSK